MNDPSQQPVPLALEVHVDGQRLKLSSHANDGLRRLGYAAPADLVADLVKQFGPIVTQALISWLLKKSTRAGGLLDDVSVDAARHLLAQLLQSYKEKLGDKAREWLEQGLEELSVYLDGQQNPPVFDA